MPPSCSKPEPPARERRRNCHHTKRPTPRARSLVGLKGYITNIPTRLMDAGEVVAAYHELWHARAVLFG